MWNVLWQIKASKFCNLRCRYCYEWDDLDRRERVPLAGWDKILGAVKRYHSLQSQRFGEPGKSFLIWHGGEPLALPQQYWNQVLARSQEILGEDAGERAFTHVVQTNLYSLTPEMMALIEREGMRVNVSLDVIPGARLSLGGEATERSVAANLDRLLERRIPVTCSVVLGAHTKDKLTEIHDFFAERGIAFGLVPLFDARSAPDHAKLAIRNEEAAEALENLFVHWLTAGCRVPVSNLTNYLDTVLLRMASLERLAWDARQNGERVFVVNTDGTLSSLVERYRPGQSLGNLFQESFDEILRSPAYEASVQRRQELVGRHCQECRYQGACDGEPIFLYHDEYPAGPCPIAFRVCRFIEDYLRLAGYDESRLSLPGLALGGAHYQSVL